MKSLRKVSVRVVASVALGSFVAAPAGAAVLTGPGGGGVPVGQSGLIRALDYSDTFTQTDQGGRPSRPSTAALQPAAAYVVENTYGHPARNFQSQGLGAGAANFSFASDGPGLSNSPPGAPA